MENLLYKGNLTGFQRRTSQRSNRRSGCVSQPSQSMGMIEAPFWTTWNLNRYGLNTMGTLTRT